MNENNLTWPLWPLVPKEELDEDTVLFLNPLQDQHIRETTALVRGAVADYFGPEVANEQDVREHAVALALALAKATYDERTAMLDLANKLGIPPTLAPLLVDMAMAVDSPEAEPEAEPEVPTDDEPVEAEDEYEYAAWAGSLNDW